jgi:hypothetical protein
MDWIESITYETAEGPVMVRKVGADWIVSNLHTGVDVGFATVPEWMSYVKATYGWPLALVVDES